MRSNLQLRSLVSKDNPQCLEYPCGNQLEPLEVIVVHVLELAVLQHNHCGYFGGSMVGS
tara:strand:- start:610 stop:786 length:177 start_codon:yes stop_codon:yes gene_type:complete